MLIEKIKPISYKQKSHFGGFFYSLANLLNNKNILTELNYFRLNILTTYDKNKIFHKYLKKYLHPTLYIENNTNIELYYNPFRNEEYRNLFNFNEIGDFGKYNIYIVEVFLTPILKHNILVIKHMKDNEYIYVIDSLKQFIFKTEASSLFTIYKVIGYDEIIHKQKGKIYFTYNDIKHLIQ